MSRQAKVVDQPHRAIRLSAVALVWLGGLAAGFFALLSAAARYGCGPEDDGFACQTSGSFVGILIVVAAAVGLAALAVCLVAARSVLATA